MTNPVVTTIESFLGQFKTAAGAIAALTAVVAILGEVGILNAPLTGALQTVLSAVLGLLVAAGVAKGAQSAAKRAALAGRSGR